MASETALFREAMRVDENLAERVAALERLADEHQRELDELKRTADMDRDDIRRRLIELKKADDEILEILRRGDAA